jgi:hypothetical protein
MTLLFEIVDIGLVISMLEIMVAYSMKLDRHLGPPWVMVALKNQWIPYLNGWTVIHLKWVHQMFNLP